MSSDTREPKRLAVIKTAQEGGDADPPAPPLPLLPPCRGYSRLETGCILTTRDEQLSA